MNKELTLSVTIKTKGNIALGFQSSSGVCTCFPCNFLSAELCNSFLPLLPALVWGWASQRLCLSPGSPPVTLSCPLCTPANKAALLGFQPLPARSLGHAPGPQLLTQRGHAQTPPCIFRASHHTVTMPHFVHWWLPDGNRLPWGQVICLKTQAVILCL